MRPWGPLLALALGGAAANACLIDLSHQVACGDGYVDRIAGEECDPNDPEEGFLYACVGTSRPNGEGACDPIECRLINDKAQCALCGDGIVDVEAGEECDGNNFGVPCWGEGTPTCTSSCKLDFSSCDSCGNGTVDPGEECDAPDGGGGIANSRPCAGANLGTPDEIPPLRSPFMTLPYTSGSAVSCLPNCTFDRTSCGYCGNDKQNPPMRVSIVDETIESLPELCDGEDFDEAELADMFPECSAEFVRANVACTGDCLDVEPRDGPNCCLTKSAPCPEDGAPLRCCYEYSHPEADDYCLPVIVPSGGGTDGGGTAVVCR